MKGKNVENFFFFKSRPGAKWFGMHKRVYITNKISMIFQSVSLFFFVMKERFRVQLKKSHRWRTLKLKYISLHQCDIVNILPEILTRWNGKERIKGVSRWPGKISTEPMTHINHFSLHFLLPPSLQLNIHRIHH